ncbi:hypothetical protein RUM44_005815 [Polyplax serrata]|uniref:PHD-type domain-containing protein n=1 Tax=Polyplax serrata TaxID=468196 RepID=A0ABR1AY87_POLSC
MFNMSRGQNNVYFPCGSSGPEPPHIQRTPCFPLSVDDKMAGGPSGGMQCSMGEFKSPLIEPPNLAISNPKKKRRTSTAVTPQQSPVLQDLMPQQPSTLGDTIVASNPFDDTPQQSGPSIMGHHMHMGMHMNSPMHSPHNIGHIGPPLSSPMNNMGITMVGNPMSSPLGMGSPMGSPHMIGMMNGGQMGPLGSPMSSGPNMMGPNGPMGSPLTQNQHMGPSGPMGSPMSNNSMNMMNSNMVGNPMTSPLAGPPIGSPMMGSPHMNIHNGPMGSPMTQNSTVMSCGPSPNSCGPSPNSCSVSTSAAGSMPANVQCGPCGPRLPGGGCVGPRMMPPPAMGHMPPHLMGPHGFSSPKPLPVSAGKVYPPDQPMVFNPQNPNAPPIYPCGICHKEVHDNDQAILCESGCNFWFHRMCTGLTEPAYQLLTAEVYAEWVCDKCLNSKNIPLVKFKP